MNSNRSKNELPDHDVDLESDALWSLLGTAGTASTASADPAREEASPRFTSETLRRLRIEKSSAKPAWWKPLLAAKPLLVAASAAVAALAIFLSLPSGSPASVSPPSPLITDASESLEGWHELEDAIASELLANAAEDPSLLSDSEIVALLF